MRRLWASLALSLVLLLSAGIVRGDAGIDGLTNDYRTANGLAPIATSALLTDLAAQRAQEIECWTAEECEENYRHDYWWWGPSGCSGIGENLVYRIPPPADPAGYAVTSWINSDPHRANLVGDWDVMGSAINGGFMVQLFGRDCSGSAPPPAPIPSATPAPIVVVLPDTAMDR